MAEIKVFNIAGEDAGTTPIPQSLASARSRVGLVHQVAVAEMAGRRQGTSNTLRRDMVAGSGVKIRRQKGTGRSRQGDKRVPHMRGGGVVHGPKPRSYQQNTPRKMRRAAFSTALNSRVQNDLLFVLEGQLAEAKTRSFAALLGKMGLSDRKLLLLVDPGETTLQRAARNLSRVQVQTVEQTGLVDVLGTDVVLCTRTAWEQLSSRVENAKGSSRAQEQEVAA